MKIKKIALFIIIILSVISGLIFFVTVTQKEKIKITIPFITPKNITVELYFSSKDAQHLVKERTQVLRLNDDLSQANAIINELIKGPKSKNLFPTIPEETQLRGLYFHENTAYVDFSNELIKKHPGGSSGEIITIFSIVNTITFNFPKIKYVHLLVEGNEVDTIAGHVDTTCPFKQNLSIIEQKTEDQRPKTKD